MTQREEFEKWLNTLDKQTLVTMAAKQAKTINLMQTAKSTSFNLPECMDYEFHGDKVINDPFADGYNQCLSDVISMNEEYANSTGSDGWKLVPVEPTVDQFGGMARDIIQWMRFTDSKDQHSESLVKWLKDMGNEIPSWLYSESEVNHLSKHVISKGTIAAIIYKAMLEAAPEQNK